MLGSGQGRGMGMTGVAADPTDPTLRPSQGYIELPEIADIWPFLSFKMAISLDSS